REQVLAPLGEQAALARHLHLRADALVAVERAPRGIGRVPLWQQADEVIALQAVLRGRVTVQRRQPRAEVFHRGIGRAAIRLDPLQRQIRRARAFGLTQRDHRWDADLARLAQAA